MLSHFNRATLSKTGLIVLRKRTDATCPEQLTVISLPMRPFLDLGVRHQVAGRSKNGFSSLISCKRTLSGTDFFSTVRLLEGEKSGLVSYPKLKKVDSLHSD